MKNLLQKGANIDHQDEDGRTALYVAVNNYSPLGVDILLGANADPNLCNNKKKSPLMIACNIQHTDITRPFQCNIILYHAYDLMYSINHVACNVNNYFELTCIKLP